MAFFFTHMIDIVPINVILREGHASSIGITEIPVENGSKITDNAYIEPKKLELDFADGLGAVTYNMLVLAQEKRTPFTFVSGLMVYQNMLIKEIHAERTAENAEILLGGCTLQEVIIVSTSKTAGGEGKAQGSGKSNDNKAQGTTTRGDQATKSVDAGSVKNQSILKSVVNPSSAPLRQSSPGGVGGV